MYASAIFESSRPLCKRVLEQAMSAHHRPRRQAIAPTHEPRPLRVTAEQLRDGYVVFDRGKIPNTQQRYFRVIERLRDGTAIVEDPRG